MSERETQTVGVALTNPEAIVLWDFCQWVKEDPSRIGRVIYLDKLPEDIAQRERGYAEGIEKLGATACEKLAAAIQERFSQFARGPRKLPEGGDRK